MIAVNKKTIGQAISTLIVFVAAMYLLYVWGVFDFFTDKHRMLAFIDEHRTYAAFIFIGFQILQVVAAPIPGEVTGFVGGVFFGTFWGIFYSTIGLTIGSWIAFILARLVGRPLVEKLVKPETIGKYDYVMKHKGMFLAFLMFLIPGFPKDYLCYLLGLGHMRQGEFLAVSILGRLLGTSLLTMGGTFFRDERYGALSIVTGVCVAVILLTMIFRDKIERLLRRFRAVHRLKTREKKRI